MTQVAKTFPKGTNEADLPKLPEGMEWVQNLMSGIWVQQAKDTPYACRVDRESYWCN